MLTMPDAPNVDLPVAIETCPLRPFTPASAVESWMEPLEVWELAPLESTMDPPVAPAAAPPVMATLPPGFLTVLRPLAAPPEMETLPPVPPSLRSLLLPTPAAMVTLPPALLAEEVSPATMRTCPPLPELPAPTATVMLPPPPCLALPEVMSTVPELPRAVSPVASVMGPLLPLAPALAVRMDTGPLEAPSEKPLVMDTRPPVREAAVVEPASTITSPPTPESPEPTLRWMWPPRPLVALPVDSEM
jgi:hypothetical protein